MVNLHNYIIYNNIIYSLFVQCNLLICALLISCLFLFQFAVHFKSRNNNVLKKKDVIDLVAMIVTGNGSHPHVVNLDSPQLVVCVIIIKVHVLYSCWVQVVQVSG